MRKREEEKPKYFQEALADFMHDAASGGAIRHLLDLGYTTNAIMQKLDYPTPRERVEKTVYRYLTEKRILLEQLPAVEEDMRITKIGRVSEAAMCAALREYLRINGEENSYVSCPFGTIRRDREARLQKMMSCITTKERDYLLGIPWQQKVMYHRLDSHMLEIAICLVVRSDADLKFYFLKSKEVLIYG